MVEVFGKKATRFGFGEALIELGKKDPKIFVLGADTAASVAVSGFGQQFPERFINVGIAETNMLGMAAGLAVAGYIPFAATYGVFAAGRPWEQIRTTICYSDLNVKIGGSHSGLMVGPDGATHQALEEIAIMRVLPKMKVVVPCDFIETKKATVAGAYVPGPLYIRYGRENTPIITKEETPFEIGKANVLRDGKDVAIMACGTMVYEALMAADILEKKGINARVINMHTVKPIDEQAIIKAAKECGAIVTAEEHQLMAGFGSAVAEAVVKNYPVPMEFVGVNDRFGESGEPFDLMIKYGLKDVNIAAAAEKVLKRK
ncbi:transketolase family protein [Endomicrobium proavitum]|uniref:Putative transketolase C-terminal section n=1 Tax=Endomicrobium proavitum TaxID=1408281 RepID=A0A0G3WH28_9BACT|nr:transketolase family protein [Endomicrobium proavitum]AKL97633.1 putative transketolase C-terminal section [Endomicrobium proavitum]